MFAHATVEIMKAIIQDPPLLFIAGLMGVTAGLAIILVHNVSSGGALPIIVTLFGWVSPNQRHAPVDSIARSGISGLHRRGRSPLFRAFHKLSHS
jgi:hypothetical protein